MTTQSRPPVILMTRPVAQSARFAAALKARCPGIRVVTAPLIAPRFMPVELPDRAWTALILTSETAAHAAGRITADGNRLPKLAFCVGDHTAEMAEAEGFTAVSAQGNAGALIELILSQNPKAPLLHLRGRDSRGDIAERLGLAGIETHEAITYGQDAQPLTAEADLVLQGKSQVIAPLFSARTVEVLVQECRRLGLAPRLNVIALSPSVAAAAQSLAANLTIAARPDAEAMIDAISAFISVRRTP